MKPSLSISEAALAILLLAVLPLFVRNLLAIPVLALVGYQFATRALYGHGLLADAGVYATAIHQSSILLNFKSVLAALAFTGGCLAVVTFFAPLLWSGRQLLIGYLSKRGYRVTGFASGVGLRRLVEREIRLDRKVAAQRIELMAAWHLRVGQPAVCLPALGCSLPRRPHPRPDVRRGLRLVDARRRDGRARAHPDPQVHPVQQRSGQPAEVPPPLAR